MHRGGFFRFVRAPRRRRGLVVAMLVATAALGVFMISNAQAVHNLGVFELDGNAVNDPTAGDDWDNVCHQVAGSDCSTLSDTTGATAVSWSNDCNDGSTTCVSDNPTSTSDRSASTFTGGGSKDPQNINAWAWNDGTGGLPDKDNLVHSYAARYTVTGTGGATDCPAVPLGNTCDVIYFGLDRFDNSGDAQTGFWFLQNKCAEGTNKVGGGTGFACVDPTPGTDTSDDYHVGFDTCTGPANNPCGPNQSAKGDLLVLSDFSIGGTTSTISIYRWDPTCKKAGGKAGNGNTCGDANLALVRSSTNANCGTPGLQNDDFCGLVNADTTSMPWSFTDKSGTASSGALNGEFYEAGINLTPLGLGGECFATLVSETRSSTSTTATLKDFIVSPFAPCQAEIATDVNASNSSSATNVHPTEAVHDHATITGNQAGKIPGVSDGDSKIVTFFLCKNTDPTDAHYNSCPAGSANQLGGSIGFGTLTQVSGSNVASETDSPNVNCAADGAGCAAGKNPLSTGHYCFRAEWTGDANYSTKLVEDGSISNECFDVVVIPTDIKTKQSWYPNDTATITSTQTGDNLAANGTVVFTLYNNGTCSGTPLYKETKDTGSAGHSVELSTGNPGHGDPASPGGPATSYQETTAYGDAADSTTTDRSWKVVYTPPSGDNAHTGVQSSCTTTAPAHIEKHSYKYTNDPGTLPNP